MSQPSKYRGLLDARRNADDPQSTPGEPAPLPAPPAPQADALPSPAPRRGRPPGKRSDPDHVQVTAYITEDLQIRVEEARLSERRKTGRRLEFSELVSTLLEDWLRSRA